MLRLQSNQIKILITNIYEQFWLYLQLDFHENNKPYEILNTYQMKKSIRLRQQLE